MSRSEREQQRKLRELKREHRERRMALHHGFEPAALAQGRLKRVEPAADDEPAGRDARSVDESRYDDHAGPVRLCSIDDACLHLACSKRTIWRMVDEGLLPQPVHAGRAGKSHFPMSSIVMRQQAMLRTPRRRAVAVDRQRDARGRYMKPGA